MSKAQDPDKESENPTPGDSQRKDAVEQRYFIHRRGMRMGPYFSYSQIETSYRKGILRGTDLLVLGKDKQIGDLLQVFGALTDEVSVPKISTTALSFEKIETSETFVPPESKDMETASQPAAGFMTLSGKIVHSKSYGVEIKPELMHCFWLLLDFSWRMGLGTIGIVAVTTVLRFLPDLISNLLADHSVSHFIPGFSTGLNYTFIVADAVLLLFWGLICLNMSMKRGYGSFRFAVIKPYNDIKA